MQLNELKRKTPYKGIKRIGRGRASGKGKTAGKGTKGQKARAGHKIRPDVREKLKKLPKLRGYNFATIQRKPVVINLSVLETVFSNGDTINPTVLRERHVVRGPKSRKLVVKILGDGELTKKLVIQGCAVSGSARQKIEKVGGTIS